MNVNMTEVNTSYVPAHLAIEAMRDNGYKNTAYAVAELIDNSIQAEADFVQLLCVEKEEQLAKRKMKRLSHIAVLDNGTGMDVDTLRKALQFGNGTRLERKDRKGIGRFGMGLPASSISQCLRVDVWSWQDGVDNAMHTYLDVEEVKRGDTLNIPEPTALQVPDVWKEATGKLEDSGTLVVWSKLDRMMWSKGTTLVDNSELLIGRMYRKFLQDDKVKIQLKVFDFDSPKFPTLDRFTLPNDPCYLMTQTSCPSPFDNQAMFAPFGGEHYEVKFTIDFQGEHHDVFVRLSYAKDEAREKPNAGNTPYGKHAAKNVGISVVRAGRELELDQSLVLQSDPRERWWGIEIEFPPSLDELMGVTNNKQSARNFADILRMADDIEEYLKNGLSPHQVMEQLQEEGDPRGPLLDVALFIKNQLRLLRELIKQQKTGSKSTGRHTNTAPEQAATASTNERKEQGYIGTSDKDEKMPPKQKEATIIRELVDQGIEEEVAETLAATTVSTNLKYFFADSRFESEAFFTVRPMGGAINILLNMRHPAYEHLIEILEKDTAGSDRNELIARLNKASEGLRLLLMAWARYEDELPDGARKDGAQEARSDWGRVAKNFLRNV